MSEHILVIDTETTGLDEEVDEVVQVCIRHGLDPQKYLRGDTRKLKRAITKYPGLAADLSAIATDKTSTRLDIRRVGTETQIIGDQP